MKTTLVLKGYKMCQNILNIKREKQKSYKFLGAFFLPCSTPSADAVP